MALRAADGKGATRVGIAIGMTCLFALLALCVAAPANAAPTLGITLSHSPNTMPRNYEQMSYLLTVKNTASATPTVGDQLLCNGIPAEWGGTKEWFGKPVAKLSFKYQWVRNGVPIGGANGSVAKGGPLPSYTIAPGDAGATIQCIVTGTVAAANQVESLGSSVVSQPRVVVQPQPAIAPPAAVLRGEGTSRPTVSTVEVTKRLCKPPVGWTTSATGTTTSGSNLITAVATASGRAAFTAGSKIATGVSTEAGAFRLGQAATSAGFIPAGTTIVAIGDGTLELSAAALATGSNKAITAGSQPLAVGKAISGAGIPPGTTIAAISGQTIELSAAATASATEVVLSSADTPEIGTWKNFHWLRNGSAIAGATSEKYEPLISTAKTTSGSNTLTEVATTKGTGTLASGSATVTGVTTSVGSFLVGQTVTGEGIPASTTVLAVGAGTIELSAAATASGAKALVGGALPFAVGQVISGNGIPAGATITAVSGQTLTISANATSSNAAAVISAQAPASVTTTSGSSSLTNVITSATGSGTLTSGSKSVTGLSTSTGTFLVGQPISGAGIPVGATIVGVGAGTLELSANATASGSQSLTAGSSQPLAVGQSITGPGIPAGTTITAVSGSTVTISANATASGSGVAVWGRTAGPDNNVELQCEVTGENAGGSAVGISNNSLVGVNPLGVEAAPSANPTNTPAVEFSNATNGPVTLQLELPAGLETRAFKVIFKNEAGKVAWPPSPCTTREPSPTERGAVVCTSAAVLAPQAEYAQIEVATSVGPDAPDPLIAKATVSGGGAVGQAVAEDEFHFEPPVPFAVTSLETKVSDSIGNDYTQAGGHPFSASASLSLSAVRAAYSNPETPGLTGNFRGVERSRAVVTDLPRGFIGNPRAVSQRCESLLAVLENTFATPTCPSSSVVGSFDVVSDGASANKLPIYLLKPDDGTLAQFMVAIPSVVGFFPISLVPQLEPKNGYAVRLIAPKVPSAVGIKSASVTICSYGVKLKASTEGNAHGSPQTNGCKAPGESEALPRPFLTNPTTCSETAPVTTLSVDSWEHPGVFVSKDAVSPKVTGCDRVPFSPTVDLQPTSRQADSPTGLDVSISFPTEGLESASGITQGYLKRAVVTLPKGMAVNPAAADGLGACTQAQLGMEQGVPNDEPVKCPESSKIGSAEVRTPILDETLTGSVYIAKQGDNPFKSLLALYLVVESKERGILIKLPGKVVADPQTGQLLTTFDNNPQAPIGSVDLHFNSGNRAPLLTPPTCGSYEIVSELSPWSAADPEHPTEAEISRQVSTFQVTSGPGGSPCPRPDLKPELSAGLANPVAGSTSPFVLRLSRDDGTQRFSGLNVTMPPGLTAYLKGVPYCPDSAFAGISGDEGTGAAELASPACPAASQIGSVSVGAGGGSNPFYVNTGKAYLAGPYKGAPLSIAIVTPAVAGPFDLGSVVVRSGAYVNPETAQITVKSDPLPTILHGIPLDVRDIRVSIDRPKFILAPSNCEAMAVNAQVQGEGGGSATVSNRFQVGECAALGFKPGLKLRLKGGTKRGQNPALTATVTYPKGDYANIKRVSVALPHSEFLDQSHIRTVCTRVQFAADACPPGSIYGHAEATSPLLGYPLTGPVYLRSSSHKLPDLVVALKGPAYQPISIVLDGRIDSVKGGIRNSFETVPDAPVSRFVLKMKGGKKGLLVNSRDICKSPARATVKMDGQNGKIHDFRPVLKSSCKGKSKSKRSGGHGRGGKK